MIVKSKVSIKYTCEVCGFTGDDTEVTEQPCYDRLLRRENTKYMCVDVSGCLARIREQTPCPGQEWCHDIRMIENKEYTSMADIVSEMDAVCSKCKRKLL